MSSNRFSLRAAIAGRSIASARGQQPTKRALFPAPAGDCGAGDGTRGIIDAILDGSILKAPTKKVPFFDFEVPTELPNVNPAILDPRDTYASAAEWEEKAKDLAARFIKNFKKYEGNEAGKALVAAGPKL